MPSLRVLSVAILVGMGAAVAAVGGGGDSGEPGNEPSGALIISRPNAAPASASAAFDVRAENQREGTPGWRISRARGTKPGLAGYAGAVSVLPGQPVPLSVSGAGSVRIRALRIGWYDGVGARQVWRGTLRARPETADPAHWQARGLADTTGWPEGHYLLRLDQGEASRYLPLTVRSADSRGRIVVLTSPLTWQAENTPAASTVSFNRPYAAGYGSAGFLPNDAGVVQTAERTGQRIGFLTDYDVATNPALLAGAAAVLVGGDSQYWTASLRAAVRAVGNAGTNLAFFGAGTGSRQIRLVDTGRAVQISRAKPAGSVQLTGLRPSCSGKPSRTSSDGTGWVVSNADWWGYRGTGLQTDAVLPDLIADRVDRASGSAAGSPHPLQVLSFARTSCPSAAGPVPQSGVYLVRPSGAGVFAAGTGRWACALTGACPNRSGQSVRMDEKTKRAVIRITRNVITAFAKAEAGKRYPAKDSVSQYSALR